jgi:hypothetical protein
VCGGDALKDLFECSRGVRLTDCFTHCEDSSQFFVMYFRELFSTKQFFFLLLLFGRHFRKTEFPGGVVSKEKKSIKCKTDANLWEPSVLGFTGIGPALGSTSCGPGPYSSKAHDLRLYPTRNFVRIFLKIQAQRTLGNCLFFFVFFFPGGSGFYLFHGSHKKIKYLHSYRPSVRSAYSSTYQVVVLFLSFFFTAQSV